MTVWSSYNVHGGQLEDKRMSRHIPQELIDDARDAVKCGKPLAEIAGRLGLNEDYLGMLLRSDLRPKSQAATLPI